MRDFEIHIKCNKDGKITKCEVLIEGKPATLEDLTDEELVYFDDELKNLSKEYVNEQY